MISKKTVPTKLKGKKSTVKKNNIVNVISIKLKKKKLILMYLLMISEVRDKLNIIIIKIGSTINRW